MDVVNHPPHYQGFSNGAEVIDITENLNFNLGNVVKYVSRAGRKTDSPVEDLRKAQWYLNRELARIDGEAEAAPVANGHRLRPRQWKLLDSIPPDVVVEDNQGDYWRRIGGTGKFQISPYPGDEWEDVEPIAMRDSTDYGPFTEVIG